LDLVANAPGTSFFSQPFFPSNRPRPATLPAKV
jgi:hypothetical protein